MAMRAMSISITGCLYNCIRDYQDKMRQMKNLLNDTFVKDEIEDEIKEYLGDDASLPVDEILDNFFDTNHGMIKIGTMLIEDMISAKNGNFSNFQILSANTDEEKNAIKQIVDMLN